MGHSEEEKIALNEAFFRQLNQRIAEAADVLHEDDGTVVYSLMCECSVFTCPEMVRLTMDEYQEVRKSPKRFIVAPEHIVEGVERPIEKHDRYWIIEKMGLASEIVEMIAEAEEEVIDSKAGL